MQPFPEDAPKPIRRSRHALGMRVVQILRTLLALAVMTPVAVFLVGDQPKHGIMVAACLVFCLIGVGLITVTWMARDVR